MTRYFLSILSFLLIGIATHANNDKYTDPYKDYEESAFMDMTLEENILTPRVTSSEHGPVKRYMSRLGDNLVKKGYTVDLSREDEVVVVTIPTDILFQPNDTLLMPSGLSKMKPIVELLKDPEMFKLVYTVNTDNTGSEQYNMWLSHERNNSIYDWLLQQVSEDQIVIPFEMGDHDPVEKNDSRKGRAANRRVEFYLIPGPKMITLAHKKLLK